MNVDASVGAKHNSIKQPGPLSGVLDQLVPLEHQSHDHFYLVHGETLTNAVPKKRSVGEKMHLLVAVDKQSHTRTRGQTLGLRKRAETHTGTFGKRCLAGIVTGQTPEMTQDGKMTNFSSKTS